MALSNNEYQRQVALSGSGESASEQWRMSTKREAPSGSGGAVSQSLPGQVPPQDRAIMGASRDHTPVQKRTSAPPFLPSTIPLASALSFFLYTYTHSLTDNCGHIYITLSPTVLLDTGRTRILFRRANCSRE